MTFLPQCEAELQRFVQAVGKEAKTKIREDVRPSQKYRVAQKQKTSPFPPSRNNKKTAPQLGCKKQKSSNVTVKILFVKKGHLIQSSNGEWEAERGERAMEGVSDGKLNPDCS